MAHPYGVVLLLAAICAIGVPERHRLAALSLIAMFAANWANSVLSYTDHPPVALLWSIGIMLGSEELWKLMDAAMGVAAAMFFFRSGAWWCAALYALSIAQITFHGLYWDVPMMPKSVYYNGLDGLFLAQAALFIAAGGPGLVDRISRSAGLHRLGNLARSLGFAKTKR